MVDFKDYAPFAGLLIFGNIENLILASSISSSNRIWPM